MKTSPLILFLLMLSLCVSAQKKTPTQSVEGRIIDKETKQPMAGAIVFVEDTYPVISTMTDLEGYFRLDDIPVGRQTLKAQKAEYNTFYTDNLVLRSAKETYLEIEMRRTPGTNQISVADTDNRENLPNNEFAAVSTRSFTAEETQRYPSSINDPGRMVLGFPGVQSYQDNESDAFIRGNPISGALFRVEGLDLLCLGHFANPLSPNGGISALSISLLDDSDFSTGAFSAEYGNASSAVYDLRFRRGNINSREYTFRLGLIGIDFATEGPIKKGRSSYLFNYRYSTLGILSAMGFYIVRPNVSNTFQDLSFNTVFESEDRKNIFTIFGIGGLANEQWFPKDSADWLTRLDFNRINSRTLIGTVGMTYTRLLDDKSYLKILLGGNVNKLFENVDNMFLDSVRTENNGYWRHQYTVSGTYSRKISNVLRLKAGFSGHGMLYNMFNTRYNYANSTQDTFMNTGGYDLAFWLQGYVQTSINLSHRFSINAGLHALYFMPNSSYSIEPRVSMQYQLAKKSRLSLAYGLHGQIIPIGVYTLQTKDNQGNTTYPNKDLKIPKAHHAVLAYRQLLGKDMSLQFEFWYQQLFNQAVAADSSSTYALLNQRENYPEEALSSVGKGRNFGVDVIFERTFRKGFFLMASGSIFRSLYTPANGVEYRTRYDNLFASALTFGKEFNFKNANFLSLGLRLLVNGGNRYTPANQALSQQYSVLILDNSNPYSLGQSDEKIPVYYRADLRIAYRKDWANSSLLISVDVQNLSNNRGNVFQELYNVQLQGAYRRYGAGLLPIMSMQLDF